jgi:hypothetical protein
MDDISFTIILLSAKITVLDKNRLVSTIRKISLLWDSFFRILKPTDIVSLVIVTNFRIQPTKRQKQIYMKW